MLIDKIKVGDYVRNKYGIAKVIDIENKNDINILKFDRDICFMTDRKTGEEKYKINYLPLTKNIEIDKINFSSNIIDLIEVGDYVNRCPVDNINYDLDKEENVVESVTIILPYQDDKDVIYNEDIKSIVTKEQMEAMEYKIEK